MDIDEIARFDPDVIVMMPCGYGIERTLKEMKVLKGNARWESLRAVRKGSVYAVEAGAYFSKPGPRTITGLEILAKIVHPNESGKIKVPKKAFRKVTA
jgi:iron complex transport system substrate-binding protein